ncbi:hypothetical protein U0070_023897, partial [Myodes glareolus]
APRPSSGVGHQWSTGLYFPDCSTAQDAITGPNMVSGHERGSLTVRCPYDSSWKNFMKYWCRGAVWSTCETLVKTDTSEKLVKKKRVSIRDDQRDFVVTVTMKELRKSDAGIYWCGIERTGYDHKFKVNVNIDPGWDRNTRKTETSLPGDFLLSVFFVSHRSLLSSIYFKILVFLELPLFLSMLSAVLWVNRPQRCSEGGEVSLGKVQSSDAKNREKNFQAERK